jgi:Type II intron maturase
MNLKVNETKTKLTNLNEDRASFLNVNIFRPQHTKFKNKQRLLRKLRLTAPIDKIREKLEQAAVMQNGKAYPKFQLMGNSHDQIIHRYNSIYRGYMNYYSFAHNHSKLARSLHFTLLTSCAKLLAAKFKLGTTAKVFKQYGPLLRGPNSIFTKAVYTRITWTSK